MKNLVFILVLLSFAAACTTNLKDKEICFEAIYPLNYLMPDESIISVNSEKDEETPLKDWYLDHPEIDQKPVLIYPVEVLYYGELVVVDTEEQMIDIKKECYHYKEKDGVKDKDDHGCDDGDSDDCTDYDCPDIKADYGEKCKKDDGSEGAVDSNCACS